MRSEKNFLVGFQRLQLSLWAGVINRDWAGVCQAVKPELDILWSLAGPLLSSLLRGGGLPNCPEVADSLIRHFSPGLSGASSQLITTKKTFFSNCRQCLGHFAEAHPNTMQPNPWNNIFQPPWSLLLWEYNSSSSQEPWDTKEGMSHWHLETPDKHLLLLPLVTGDWKQAKCPWLEDWLN